MNARFRKSLIAGAVAAMVGAPAWAAEGDAQRSPGTTSGQSMEQGTTGSGAAGRSGPQSSTMDASNPLYSMTPQQLRRMDVVDATGEDIGRVQSVVRSRDQEDIQLVVSSGGFLGVGGREIAVPLNQATLIGDKLHLSASRAELESRPQYQSDQYVELQPADQPISDFAAFEPVPGQGTQQPGTGTTTPRSTTPGTSGSGTTGSGTTGSGSTMERDTSPSSPAYPSTR